MSEPQHSALRRLKQRDLKFKVSLGCRSSPVFTKTKEEGEMGLQLRV